MEIIINVSETEREHYIFTQFNLNFVLTEYSKQEKVKRTWKTINFWSNYYKRSSSCECPKLTDELKKIALEEVIKNIQIKHRDEHFK
jgi:hypothetical protein